MKKSLLIVSAILLVSVFINNPVSAQTVWTHVADQPVLGYGSAGEWDDHEIMVPAVIKDGDTLRMWYAGGDADAYDVTVTDNEGETAQATVEFNITG